MHSGTECGVSLAALLHLTAAIPNLSHAPDAHYHYLEDDIIRGGKLQYGDGGLAVPTGPGLGVELDEAKVERYHQLYEAFMASPMASQPRMGPVFTKPKW